MLKNLCTVVLFGLAILDHLAGGSVKLSRVEPSVETFSRLLIDDGGGGEGRGGTTILESRVIPLVKTSESSSSAKPQQSRHDYMTKLAQDHPLCQTNVTAYVGQSAKMYCCLARLDRDLSVSWIRKQHVVVLTHGHLVFTTDNRVTVSSEDGIWGLHISKVGHADAGTYECQTNSEVKGSISVNLNIMETEAAITGPAERYIKVGSSLRLSCRVYLGPEGPDEAYQKTAVVHWFQDQRLLDPLLDSWRGDSNAGSRKRRVTIHSEVTHELRGWLQIDDVTPYDAGNYTCVPSYAIPDWTQVHIVHEENQSKLHNEVSEVKVDVTSGAASATATCSSDLIRSLAMIWIALKLDPGM